MHRLEAVKIYRDAYLATAESLHSLQRGQQLILPYKTAIASACGQDSDLLEIQATYAQSTTFFPRKASLLCTANIVLS